MTTSFVDNREGSTVTAIVQPHQPLSRQLSSTGLLAIVRSTDNTEAISRATALVEAGVTVLEISFTLAGAPRVIEFLRAELPAEVLVGAGTVLSGADAAVAADAGADFLVAPNFSAAARTVAEERKLGYYPGAFSPSEIVSAWEAGVAAVKVFPAAALGIVYLQQVREPLPRIPLLAVGGVTFENAATYLDAGASAVGLGRALSSAEPSRLRAFVTELAERRAARP
ncbi:bifunctional 4-hydroxy-2-oxoglutarate aldolase/2-dehydro-3-deoxy-phosphogluconate aldolase [Subtercola vilae]|uniref:2-dehydro-3-deoxyphosphogluconate aldolase n=1 Tax=Subtercola vilae TaxID=2056433 RepID=A0A4T2BYB8_9MICO|nr:bifunctional 4-hydroxy-2-oxoglutarate aldolase/2-dehydro-3-deoxy-phosphogluconate aldolase [Subtercola vilae]TIH36637.1 2-dehydro-3-deoxyphosphogluconate aldolase [Subtercola vilae]